MYNENTLQQIHTKVSFIFVTQKTTFIKSSCSMTQSMKQGIKFTS